MPTGSVVKLRSSDRDHRTGGSASRHILLLQGPVGWFFSRLHSGFEQAGFQVTRVTFGPADRYFNRGKPSVRFRGGADEFAVWLDKFSQNKSFGAVVLFGATRPLHVVACAYFKSRGIPVLCLEEGYLRPGYITAELGGNNFQSPAANQLGEATNWSKLVQPPASTVSSFKQMARYGFTYYALHSLFAGYRERQGFHKRHRTNIGRELFCWFRNFVRSNRHGLKNMRRIEYLLENHDRNYFVVPFQVADDAQLTGAASNGWNNDSLALSVIESFARFARPTQQLVFKVHPLERGHSDAVKIVSEIAEGCGVASRVHVVDTGSIGLLTRHSAGMVTINSTSGFSAINHGVPLAVLGKAIYAIPEICTVVQTTDDLNHFWANGFAADRLVRLNYVDSIKTRCLLPGDYYLARESDIAIAQLVKKIEAIIGGDLQALLDDGAVQPVRSTGTQAAERGRA